jgi:hypothetical protein
MGGRGEMIKAPIDLQDLRRRLIHEVIVQAGKVTLDGDLSVY